MQDWWTQIQDNVGDYLPTLLAAIAVLVIGWLVALAIAALVRAALRRTGLDEKLASTLSSDPEGPPPKTEVIAGRIVFWVLMVFVLLGFFQVLGLAFVASPLNDFAGRIAGYLPNLLSAAVLVLLAWIVARVLRFVVRRGAQALDLDRRLADGVARPKGDDRAAATTIAEPGAATTAPTTTAHATAAPATSERRAPLSKTLSETVYWLTFLLFLPAILDALRLDGLLAPVHELVAEVLGYLPNVLAAALILAAGWLVARVLQRLVVNLLAAAGADRAGDRLGVSKATGGRNLSQIIGLVLYVLVLIPVVIAALNALSIEAITRPASEMLNRILLALPNLFAALVILTIAWFVGKLLAGLVANLLASLGFDGFLESIGLVRSRPAPEVDGLVDAVVGEPIGDQPATASAARRRPSEIVGFLVLVALMLFATVEALELLDFDLLATMVAEFMMFAANVLLGVLIFVLGFYLAQLAARLIRSSEVGNADLLARLAQAAIVVLAAAMALRQAGLAEDVILLAFGLSLGAIAVAAAIAFGMAGREPARRVLEKAMARTEAGGSTPGAPPRSGNEPPRV